MRVATVMGDGDGNHDDHHGHDGDRDGRHYDNAGNNGDNP
jgi:hypothetical protein